MGNYLVIGGTRGIGRKITDTLSERGHSVHVMARERGDLPVDIGFTSWDASNADMPDHGFDKLDGLVYCPGSINLKPFNRIKESDFRTDWELNFLGAVKAVQGSLQALKNAENASIVFFSTVAVTKGMAYHSSISAAKAAVEGLTRSLAAELAPGIRVNCIAPSITNTSLASRLLSTEDKIKASGERHTLQRVGEAEDIANSAIFLLGKESSWMTGEVLHTDGGMSSTSRI